MEKKKREIILAMYIAAHSSIRSVDHLTDIINMTSASSNISGPSDSALYRMHKTKYASLIRNVIGPSLLSATLKDVGDSPFSLLIDESTDISTEKLVCICIRYYSQKQNVIVTQFLTMLPIVHATSGDLYKVISDFFNKNDFTLQNLLGIGTDGASNMCGSHNSLFTHLSTNLGLDNLILAKCICHSLHLCISKASEIFKDETDFLLRESYNWFRNSTIRMTSYREIYSLINSDTSNFRRLTQLSATRWLSRYTAIDKILTQYLVLETFFKMVSVKERCHTARLLAEAYSNKENKAILRFFASYS